MVEAEVDMKNETAADDDAMTDPTVPATAAAKSEAVAVNQDENSNGDNTKDSSDEKKTDAEEDSKEGKEKEPEKSEEEKKAEAEAEKKRIEELKKKYADWPLRDIKEPHDNDVMYGRGGP